MKKIGKLNGKVVVSGNKNLITANQIHYEEREGNITLSSRGGGKELNSITGDSGESSASKLKSRKVCWMVDNQKVTDETFNQLKILLLEVLMVCPLYSSIYEEYDSATSSREKYYGPFVNMPLCGLLFEDSAAWNVWYFEEAEDIENNYDGLMGCFKELEPSITEEMIYEMCGLKRIPYEEYVALRVDTEKGKNYIQ